MGGSASCFGRAPHHPDRLAAPLDGELLAGLDAADVDLDRGAAARARSEGCEALDKGDGYNPARAAPARLDAISQVRLPPSIFCSLMLIRSLMKTPVQGADATQRPDGAVNSRPAAVPRALD